MFLDPAKVTYYMGQASSIRGAWRLYCENEIPVAWDTFRKRTAPEFLEHNTPCKTVLAIFDIHYPNQSNEVLDIIKTYASDELGEIDSLVLGGDIVNSDSLSRFTHDPFKSLPIHQEFELAHAELKSLVRDIGAKETVYICGNHEKRLQSFLFNKAPEISRLRGLTVQEQLRLDELGIQWVDNLERKSQGKDFFKIGKLCYMHGHELGITPMIGPARRYFMRSFEPMICGHVHRVDEHFERNLSGQLIGTWVCGCACDLNPDYRPSNSWVSGFAVIQHYPDGLFNVSLKKIINTKVL